MPNDDEEEDPYAYESSLAGAMDRMLYGMGWLVAIFFVVSSILCFIGFPTEAAVKITIHVVGACVPILVYYGRE